MSKEKAKQQQIDLRQQDNDFYVDSIVFNEKVKARIKNSLTAKYYPKKYEVNNMPSMTIPDQAMSLKTILERYAKGLPITTNVNQPIEQEPGGEGIDLRKLDLAEREQLLDNLKGKIKDYQERQKPPKDEASALILS